MLRSMGRMVVLWATIQIVGAPLASAFDYTEPPDLEIFNPGTDLGRLDEGTNTIAGQEVMPPGFLLGDLSDEFTVEVAYGYTVTGIRLEISNFSSPGNERARFRSGFGAHNFDYPVAGSTSFLSETTMAALQKSHSPITRATSLTRRRSRATSSQPMAL